jgi:hypothetical protein
LAAGVPPGALYASAKAALQADAVERTGIKAVSGHPEIVGKRVQFGLLPAGERDRTALSQSLGFLPNPHGATFIGKAIFGSGQAVMDAQRPAGPDDETLDLEQLFPPANAMQEKLVAVRQRTLLPPTEEKRAEIPSPPMLHSGSETATQGSDEVEDFVRDGRLRAEMEAEARKRTIPGRN